MNSKVKSLNIAPEKLLTVTPIGNDPVKLIWATGGTCHHVLPVAQTLAASDLTMGVPRQPKPLVHVEISILFPSED